MTAKEFVIGLLFLLAGMFSVGLLVFFTLLYLQMKKLTDAAVKVAAVIGPLSNERVVTQLVESVLAIRSYLPAIGKAMDGLSSTLGVFTKVMLNGEAADVVAQGRDKTRAKEKPGIEIAYGGDKEEEMAPEGSSSFAAPTEDEVVLREMKSQLERSGMKMRDDEAPEPPSPENTESV